MGVTDKGYYLPPPPSVIIKAPLSPPPCIQHHATTTWDSGRRRDSSLEEEQKEIQTLREALKRRLARTPPDWVKTNTSVFLTAKRLIRGEVASGCALFTGRNNFSTL